MTTDEVPGSDYASDLVRIAVSRKNGREPFRSHEQPLGAQLKDFWSWASSDLLDNATRGRLAEYLVGLALDCVQDATRIEWDAADLRTGTGYRVEVKSAAYLQSWRQTTHSRISFDIRPTLGWDADTNTYCAQRRRQADVYVFCLFAHKHKPTADPMNTDQWQFHVVSTRQLNQTAGEQKTITLASLLTKVRPASATFPELRYTVDAAAEEDR